MVEVTPLLDNLRHFTLRVYRQIWNRIRQYWTEERWIRVTGDENNVRFVGFNRPPELSPEQAMTAMAMIQMHLQAGELDEQTAQQYAQQVQEKASVQNPVGELDVDIEIDEVNETPTLQAEQFQELATLIGQSPVLASNPKAIEMLIKASNLRDKQELVEIIQEMQQQPNPMAQIAPEQAKAEIDETKSKTALNIAKANDLHNGSIVNAFNAEVAAQQPQAPPAFLSFNVVRT
jgi:hypothetical protein